MKLSELLKELSQIGELAQHEARQQYVAHLHNLHGAFRNCPASPAI